MAVSGCEIVIKHLKKFTIQRLQTTVGENGLASQKWQDVGALFGIISNVRPDIQVQWQQLQHPVTHSIMQRGEPKAKQDDRLILGDRAFYVQGVKPAGAAHGWTVYMCEERADLNVRSRSQEDQTTGAT